MRVVVVGARRRRQGTGEYVARELNRLGCQTTAIVGTSRETLAEARDALERNHGIACPGFLSLGAALDAGEVDAVAICSPPDAHLSDLELAIDRGCHVFCEKPLWWSEDLRDAPTEQVTARATALWERCLSQKVFLGLNTQWPFTLDAFRELHPDPSPVQRFEMWLGPVSTGPAMVVDSGSHLISMLQALAGPGAVEKPCVVDEGSRMTLTCSYRAETLVEVELRLTQCLTSPRPAGYAINGNPVERHVELPGYRISFAANDRRVDVRDPLTASVEAFVRSARDGERPLQERIVDGMTQLHQLVQAAKNPEES